jgi:hypothetical protein
MIKSKIRRLHSRKSSKLIFFVAGGVALVVLAFFALVIIGGGGEGRGGSMARTLRYLKNTEGLVEIKALDAEKRVIIVYNSDSKNAANFEKIAYYAALRLAPHWPDCEVLLARNEAGRIVYEIRVRAGTVVAEGKP